MDFGKVTGLGRGWVWERHGFSRAVIAPHKGPGPQPLRTRNECVAHSSRVLCD
jgi:hypothetical protein